MRCACGEWVDIVGSEADYPHDSGADDAATGLDKLRTVADRGFARTLHALWFVAQHNDRCVVQRTAEADRQRCIEAEDLENLEACSARALAGDFGPRAREVADELMTGAPGFQRRAALEQVREQVRRVRTK